MGPGRNPEDRFSHNEAHLVHSDVTDKLADSFTIQS